jgi:hypothetical protein
MIILSKCVNVQLIRWIDGSINLSKLEKFFLFIDLT